VINVKTLMPPMWVGGWIFSTQADDSVLGKTISRLIWSRTR